MFSKMVKIKWTDNVLEELDDIALNLNKDLNLTIILM